MLREEIGNDRYEICVFFFFLITITFERTCGYGRPYCRELALAAICFR